MEHDIFSKWNKTDISEVLSMMTVHTRELKLTCRGQVSMFRTASTSWCDRILLQINHFTLCSLCSLLPAKDKYQNQFCIRIPLQEALSSLIRDNHDNGKTLQIGRKLDPCTSCKGVYCILILGMHQGLLKKSLTIKVQN